MLASISAVGRMSLRMFVELYPELRTFAMPDDVVAADSSQSHVPTAAAPKPLQLLVVTHPELRTIAVPDAYVGGIFGPPHDVELGSGPVPARRFACSRRRKLMAMGVVLLVVYTAAAVLMAQLWSSSLIVDHQAKRSYERLTLDHGSPTVGTVSHSKTSTPDVMPPIEATTTSRSTTRWRAFVMPINQIREFLMTAPTLRPPADGSMPENCARVLEMQLKGPLGTNQSPILKIYTNDCERIRKNALNKRQ